MVEREPDYASCSLRDLLDVERRIDRTAYPERWRRLQDELAKRRHGGSVPSTGTSPHPIIGLGGYVTAHVLICPTIAGVAAFLLDRGGGEGSGCLPMVVVPLVGALALTSFATHSVYCQAADPDRQLLISIAITAIGAPSVAFGVLSVVAWLAQLLS
jgi:hypothetical protein